MADLEGLPSRYARRVAREYIWGGLSVLPWSSPGKMGTLGLRELAEKFVARVYYAGSYYEESLLNVNFR